MELSTRPEKYMGEPRLWEKAEATLKRVLDGRNVRYEINKGRRGLLRTKIDFKIKDSLGREWQTATIQLDFQMPERFQVRYTGEDGREHTPIMLHKAIYGSIERFIGILLEHLNGNMPSWLAPIQARVVAIKDSNEGTAKNVYKRLFDLGFRVELDLSNGTVESKIRDAELQKIPYIIVIGDKEVEAGTLAVRKHGEKSARFGVKLEEFVDRLNSESWEIGIPDN